MQTVITIHGVNPSKSTSWQDRVGQVLKPHFKCEHITYGGYDGLLGVIRVVCDPVFPAVLALVGVIVITVVGRRNSSGILIALSVLLLLLIGAGLAAFQRRRCAAAIKARISSICATVPRPHLIAHSFGTYLAGRALKYADVTLDRIALVGSVLPRGFDWHGLLKSGRKAFGSVRNETGSKDFVVWLAGRTRWFAWDIGEAGLRGFEGPHVHNTTGPLSMAPDGSVHNVPLKEYAHSDVFLGPGHAKRLWLPFLWGFPPSEFNEYVMLCGDARGYLHDGISWQFEIELQELADKVWAWTYGMPMADFIRKLLLREPKVQVAEKSIDDLIKEVLTYTCIFTAEAYEETIDERIQRALHPWRSVAQAVRAVLEDRP